MCFKKQKKSRRNNCLNDKWLCLSFLKYILIFFSKVYITSVSCPHARSTFGGIFYDALATTVKVKCEHLNVKGDFRTQCTLCTHF